MGYKTHINPDGTEGGEVSHDAVVERGAVVEKHGVVLPGARVRAGETVEGGTVVTACGRHMRVAAKPRGAGT